MRLLRTSVVTKLIIVAVIVYAAVTVVSLQPKIDALVQERNELAAQADAAVGANDPLRQDIDALGSDESVRQIARERLHLVEDGELIYVDSTK